MKSFLFILKKYLIKILNNAKIQIYIGIEVFFHKKGSLKGGL